MSDKPRTNELKKAICQLTRREAQVMRHLLAGGRVCADYKGGPSEAMKNWDFALWGEGLVEGCAPSARTLIAKGLARISDPNALGYRFLTPNAEVPNLRREE